MKPWIPGAVGALAVLVLFPAEHTIADRWSRAIAVAPGSASKADSSLYLDSSLLAIDPTATRDTTPLPDDPFGLPPEPVVSDPRPAMDIGTTAPPPRIWKATGRVGERAALLSSPDGRILVVNVGMKVDSATVVSIGNGGVTLEDRAGRFALRIP